MKLTKIKLDAYDYTVILSALVTAIICVELVFSMVF